MKGYSLLATALVIPSMVIVHDDTKNISKIFIRAHVGTPESAGALALIRPCPGHSEQTDPSQVNIGWYSRAGLSVFYTVLNLSQVCGVFCSMPEQPHHLVICGMKA